MFEIIALMHSQIKTFDFIRLWYTRTQSTCSVSVDKCVIHQRFSGQWAEDDQLRQWKDHNQTHYPGGGGHLGKNGYGDEPLGRVPFSTSKNLWQGSKITKFQEMALTGLEFCNFLTLTGSNFCNFSTFFAKKSGNQYLTAVHFSISRRTSPSVVKVSAPRAHYMGTMSEV